MPARKAPPPIAATGGCPSSSPLGDLKGPQAADPWEQVAHQSDGGPFNSCRWGGRRAAAWWVLYGCLPWKRQNLCSLEINSNSGSILCNGGYLHSQGAHLFLILPENFLLSSESELSLQIRHTSFLDSPSQCACSVSRNPCLLQRLCNNVRYFALLELCLQFLKIILFWGKGNIK